MFESLKKKLQHRIERDAVKSFLTYTTKEGEEITETVYLKKSKMPLTGDWTRIYPPINEDGSWNIVNLLFGGKKNLTKLLIILAIVLMVFFQFADIFRYVETLTSNPCVQQCISNNPLL